MARKNPAKQQSKDSRLEARRGELTDEQLKKFKEKVKKHVLWPNVSTKEWKRICFDMYGVELRPGDLAYEKMATKVKNERYKDKQLRKEELRKLGEQPAVVDAAEE